MKIKRKLKMAKNTVEQPMTEKDWQARMDAQTIADAAIITNDQNRMSAAQKMANKMVEDKAKQMEQMQVEHQALSDFAMKDKKKDMGNTSKLKIDKPKKMEKKQNKDMKNKPKVKKAK
jgi:hypothetical protein